MNAPAPRFRWLFVVAIAAVGLIGWATSSATSAPAGLTKSKAKKLFYTKKAADKRYLTPSAAEARYLTQSQGDGRYLTQAQGDGRYLTDSQADARYLGVDGATTVQASPIDWQLLAPFAGQLQRSVDSTTLNSGPPDSTTLGIGAPIPTELEGRAMKLVKVNACYATPNATTLSQVTLGITTNNTGAANTVSPVVDPTDRTDDACRDYVPATPIDLGPGATVALSLSISFAGGGGNSFNAGRATFYLAP